MKRILTVLFLMITIYGFGQVPSNYLNIRSRYNLIAVKTDSGFHVPGYSTIPNYRGGVWTGSGNVGVDTVNHKFYFYSGGSWREAGATYTFTNGITESGGTVRLGGALTNNTSITNPSGYEFEIHLNEDADLQGLVGDNYSSFIGFANGETRVVKGSAGININNSIAITYPKSGRESLIEIDENGIAIKPSLKNLTIDSLNATTSTTGKKIMLRDTATGLVQNIDPALIGSVTVSSFAKNTTRDSTILTLSDGTRFAAKDSTGGGSGADSSVFATLYRVDTAKVNIRSSIASKVSGSGTANQLALWDGTSSVTGMPQYTFSSNAIYPEILIGAPGTVGSTLFLRDAAGTYMSMSSGGGVFGLFGSSTYKNIQIYSHAGGSLMAQFYRPTSYNLIDLNGLVRSNNLTVLSNYEGNYHIPRTVPYAVGGNNYHGFTDGTDFRQGTSAFNSFGSFVKFGNNSINQDHYAAFQNVWTKDSSNTMGKVYGFVNAVSEMKAGTITDLYGYYYYCPTITGGTITNQYGIYVPEITGATKNVGAYIESNVGIGTSSPSEKLHVVGNILTSGTITTAAPTSGTAKPWKLGEVASVSPTSPNRTIRVEIDGTVYFIHAKTTND